jgi:hypothetical protein
MTDQGFSTDSVQNEAPQTGSKKPGKLRKYKAVLDGVAGARSSWISMLGRCKSPKTRGYRRYGGRGIKVCERWKSFGNFLADMGPRPPNHSIDRINNDGDYEPGNCRWATRLEQQKNKPGYAITYAGETLTVKEWAARLGVPSYALHSRLRKMPLERAMSPWLKQRSLEISQEQALARAGWDYIASLIALKGEEFLREVIASGETDPPLTTDS